MKYLALLYFLLQSFLCGCKTGSNSSQVKDVSVSDDLRGVVNVFALKEDTTPGSNGVVDHFTCRVYERPKGLEPMVCTDKKIINSIAYSEFRSNLTAIVFKNLQKLTDFSRTYGVLLGGVVSRRNDQGLAVCPETIDLVKCNLLDMSTFDKRYEWLAAAVSGVGVNSPEVVATPVEEPDFKGEIFSCGDAKVIGEARGNKIIGAYLKDVKNCEFVNFMDTTQKYGKCAVRVSEKLLLAGEIEKKKFIPSDSGELGKTFEVTLDAPIKNDDSELVKASVNGGSFKDLLAFRILHIVASATVEGNMLNVSSMVQFKTGGNRVKNFLKAEGLNLTENDSPFFDITDIPGYGYEHLNCKFSDGFVNFVKF